VLLRFAQEMNGDWYPWGKGINGNQPGQFVQAWRHVHDVFASVHATNVLWVWSPVARYGVSLDTSEYPGDAYVNIIGLSGFNGGSALPWTGWRTFASLFDSSLLTVHQLAPDKPVQISEVSSAAAGGSRAAWIADMFSDLRQQPNIRSVVWFDVDKQTGWSISRHSRAAAAFASGLRGYARASLSGPDLITSRPKIRTGPRRAMSPASTPSRRHGSHNFTHIRSRKKLLSVPSSRPSPRGTS
jgi:hypothetical protein